MLRRLILSAASIVTLFVLTSCSLDGKSHYVEKFGAFVTEVEKQGPEYTDHDWEKADQQYRLYSDVYLEKYKEELTEEEMLLIGDYILRYRQSRTAREWERILNSEF